MLLAALTQSISVVTLTIAPRDNDFWPSTRPEARLLGSSRSLRPRYCRFLSLNSRLVSCQGVPRSSSGKTRVPCQPNHSSILATPRSRAARVYIGSLRFYISLCRHPLGLIRYILGARTLALCKSCFRPFAYYTESTSRVSLH